MHIEELIQKITPIDAKARQLAQGRFDALIKPIGSLAKLEEMASRYCGITGVYEKHEVDYPRGAVLVWCDAEHMPEAEKIMQCGSPVNVLAAETGSSVYALVVTSASEEAVLAEGAALAQELIAENKLGIIALGCLAAAGNTLAEKAMTGAILAAAALKKPVMLDGLATCRAAKAAAALAPAALEYCFAGHVSAEAGMTELLAELRLNAPLRLGIASGAGEGAALALTIFNAGIKSYKEMETFEEAGVHVEVKEFSMAEENKKKEKTER